MFKRICIVLTAVLVVGTGFVACKKEAKKEEPAAAAKVEADSAKADAAKAEDAAKQAEAAAVKVEDAAKQVEAPEVKLEDAELEAALKAMLAGGAAPLAAVPPEAQAAMDALLEVMSAVADTSAKETCAEIVDALKLLDNDDIRAKVKKVQILETFPEDVQQALQQANLARLLGVANRMSGFAKCEETPQADEIDKLITAILASGEE